MYVCMLTLKIRRQNVLCNVYLFFMNLFTYSFLYFLLLFYYFLIEGDGMEAEEGMVVVLLFVFLNCMKRFFLVVLCGSLAAS